MKLNRLRIAGSDRRAAGHRRARQAGGARAGRWRSSAGYRSKFGLTLT